jgi:hypothetical protein
MALDVRDTREGAVLRVRAQPRASKDALGGERLGALVLRVTAPPVDGRANEAVARLLAAALGVPASAVHVVKGTTGRDKLVAIEGLGAEAVRARLSIGERQAG